MGSEEKVLAYSMVAGACPRCGALIATPPKPDPAARIAELESAARKAKRPQITFYGYAIRHPENDECWYCGDSETIDMHPTVFVDAGDAQRVRDLSKNRCDWKIVKVEIHYTPAPPETGEGK